MTSISFTVVLLSDQDRPSKLEYHVFFNLKLAKTYLTQRSGTCSVSINSLLTTIRESLSQEKFDVKDDRQHHFWHPFTRDVDVATSRVPLFNGDMHCPSLGYRQIGCLSAIDIQLTTTDILCFDNRDIIALTERRHPLNSRYAECWSPFSLTVEKHFIIILSLRPSLLRPSYLSPNPQQGIWTSST